MKNESDKVNNTMQKCVEIFLSLYFLTIVILNIDFQVVLHAVTIIMKI